MSTNPESGSAVNPAAAPNPAAALAAVMNASTFPKRAVRPDTAAPAADAPTIPGPPSSPPPPPTTGGTAGRAVPVNITTPFEIKNYDPKNLTRPQSSGNLTASFASSAIGAPSGITAPPVPAGYYIPAPGAAPIPYKPVSSVSYTVPASISGIPPPVSNPGRTAGALPGTSKTVIPGPLGPPSATPHAAFPTAYPSGPQPSSFPYGYPPPGSPTAYTPYPAAASASYASGLIPPAQPPKQLTPTRPLDGVALPAGNSPTHLNLPTSSMTATALIPPAVAPSSAAPVTAPAQPPPPPPVVPYPEYPPAFYKLQQSLLQWFYALPDDQKQQQAYAYAQFQQKVQMQQQQDMQQLGVWWASLSPAQQADPQMINFSQQMAAFHQAASVPAPMAPAQPASAPVVPAAPSATDATLEALKARRAQLLKEAEEKAAKDKAAAEEKAARDKAAADEEARKLAAAKSLRDEKERRQRKFDAKVEEYKKRAENHAEMRAAEINILAMQLEKKTFKLEQDKKSMEHNDQLLKIYKGKDEFRNDIAKAETAIAEIKGHLAADEAEIARMAELVEYRRNQESAYKLMQVKIDALKVEVDDPVPNWTGVDAKTLEHTAFAYSAASIANAKWFDPLVMVDSNKSYKVKPANNPFARGGVRLAFHCLEPSTTRRYVYKTIMGAIPELTRAKGLEVIVADSVRMQLLAALVADEFMKALNGKKADVQGYSVKYVSIDAVRDPGDTNFTFATIEPWLDGDFEKYNDNNLHVSDNAVHSTAPGLPQALSHFSYKYFNKEILLVDVQGMLKDKAYSLTDPAFHSTASSFGKTDLGKKGIENFFVNHKCSTACKALGLQTVLP